MPAVRATFRMHYLGLPLSVWQLKKVDFQFFEDKIARKLVPWDGNNITTIGRTALVKAVLTSQMIYFITPLIVPASTLENANKLERAFLWSGSDRTTDAKCKVNWEIVCYGGFGVLNTDKFARALRLRWPWYEWKEPAKLWVGMGSPCDEDDLDFFYASTTIIVGNGAKTPFWDSPYLLGRKPKDIAPLIHDASTRKNWRVREVVQDNAWIFKISPSPLFSLSTSANSSPCGRLSNVFHLDDHTEDDIVWKLAESGHYSAASVYRVQFLGRRKCMKKTNNTSSVLFDFGGTNSFLLGA